MLTQIQPQIQLGKAPASLAEALRGGDASDPIDLLLGCHARIRHFTAMAVRLSQPSSQIPAGQIPAGTAHAAEIAAAARAVHRYYSVALPLHEADENESVYPRLRAALPPGALAEANQAMVDQHVALDAIIAALLPQWRDACDHPERASASAAESRQLEAGWRDHLELEERIIFPALRTHLGATDRAAIRREMMERRQIAS